MSDSGDSPGPESSILGKRARNDNTNQGNAADDIEPAAKKLTMDDDSDDDDVGPMPMPADAPGATKKKRKGQQRVLSLVKCLLTSEYTQSSHMSAYISNTSRTQTNTTSRSCTVM